MKLNRKITSLLLIMVLCSQLILTALSNRKSSLKSFASYSNKKLSRNSAYAKNPFFFDLLLSSQDEECVYSFEEWKEAVLDERIKVKETTYAEVEYGQDEEEIKKAWQIWCRRNQVDKQVSDAFMKYKIRKTEAALESICAFGILNQLPQKFCWKSSKKSCNTAFYESCGPAACVKKGSRACFSVIFFEMILGTLGTLFDKVSKIVTGIEVLKFISYFIKSITAGSKIQDFIAYQKGSAKEMEEFLELNGTAKEKSIRRSNLIANMVSYSKKQTNNFNFGGRIEHICENVFNNFELETKESLKHLDKQESGFINYFKQKFMDFETKVRQTLENKVLHRKLSKTVCSTMDHKCFHSIVGVIGLIDPSGLVSIAAPFIRPFCQDEHLIRRRFK